MAHLKSVHIQNADPNSHGFRGRLENQRQYEMETMVERAFNQDIDFDKELDISTEETLTEESMGPC